MIRKIISSSILISLLIFSQAAFSAEAKYKSVDESENSGSTDDPFKGSTSFNKQDAMFGIGFNYFNSFGFQGRYAFRLLDNREFISEFNNALYLEGGAGMTFYGDYKNYGNVSGLHLIANIRWDARHSEKWTLFATAGFGLNFISASGVKNRDVTGGGLFPAFGVGSMYTLDQKWAARFDLSWQFLGIGLTYRF